MSLSKCASFAIEFAGLLRKELGERRRDYHVIYIRSPHPFFKPPQPALRLVRMDLQERPRKLQVKPDAYGLDQNDDVNGVGDVGSEKRRRLLLIDVGM